MGAVKGMAAHLTGSSARALAAPGMVAGRKLGLERHAVLAAPHRRWRADRRQRRGAAGEDSEQHDLEILFGNAVVRVVGGLTSPSYVYTSADQATAQASPDR
jgi:hypothetical protein